MYKDSGLDGLVYGYIEYIFCWGSYALLLSGVLLTVIDRRLSLRAAVMYVGAIIFMLGGIYLLNPGVAVIWQSFYHILIAYTAFDNPFGLPRLTCFGCLIAAIVLAIKDKQLSKRI